MGRVYLGVHFLGDVIGSWLLGAGLLAVMVLVSARWGAGSGERVS
jgi:membrane-associated phospholipid phosphatase